MEAVWESKGEKNKNSLFTCLKNSFTHQQPPLPPPPSSCASQHTAWLHLYPACAQSWFSSILPCWSHSPCTKRSGCRSHASRSVPGPSALRGQILHRSSACAAVLEPPPASLLPELKSPGRIDRDVRSTFSPEVNYIQVMMQCCSALLLIQSNNVMV